MNLAEVTIPWEQPISHQSGRSRHL